MRLLCTLLLAYFLALLVQPAFCWWEKDEDAPATETATITNSTTTTMTTTTRAKVTGGISTQPGGPAKGQELLRGLTASYDCSKGCNLGDGEFVCGTDGLSYETECLAVCQETSVLHVGPCATTSNGSGHHGGRIDASTYISTGKVKPRVLNRFKVQGYKYVARRKLVSGDGLPKEPGGGSSSSSSSSSSGGDGAAYEEDFRAVRITSEGHEYVLAASGGASGPPPELVEGFLSTTAGYKPSSGNDGGDDDDVGNDRALKVLPPDTREPSAGSKWSWPYRAIVQIELANGGQHCTGNIISPAYVLTNAHCVYNLEAGTYYDLGGVSPGRYKGMDHNPHGFWSFVDAQIFNGYKTDLDFSKGYDIAVMRIKPKHGRFVGDITGYLPMAQTNNADPGTPLQTATITGYPADKAAGTRWLSTCPNTYRMKGNNPYDVNHECDTHGGNSGSGLIDKVGVVRGVHFRAGDDDENFNTGNILRGSRYYAILQWSGLGNTGFIRTAFDRTKCLETHKSRGDKNNVFMAQCDHDSNQLWTYDYGGMEIYNLYDGKCLEYDTQIGNLGVKDCTGRSDQRWVYDSDTKEWRSQFKATNPRKCVEYSPITKNVFLDDCHGRTHQQWEFPEYFWENL